MNTTTNVLFVSASAADKEVLTTLLGRGEEGGEVRVTAAPTAQSFYDSVHSEAGFRVIVVDDRPSWSNWRKIVSSSGRDRPDALLVLLVSAEQLNDPEAALEEGVAAVYPRSSAGLLALARLVSMLAAQERIFSLRHHLAMSQVSADEEGVRDEREKLVYAVSHDLQDPLQLARRYAQMLNEDYESELGESGSKVLEHLRFNLSRTQEMLDELLDYSRVQNERPELEQVDFNELLVEVVSMYKLKLDEIGGTVTRQHSLPTLIVDRRQFQRVFQNLIGNAIKFRSEQPLHITVRSQRVRDEWRIGVKDNGIGIAEVDTQRVFDMFERGAANEDFSGSGMGLALCKRILKNHGGNIWVRSTEGSGSVFIFSLPAVDESAESTPE